MVQKSLHVLVGEKKLKLKRRFMLFWVFMIIGFYFFRENLGSNYSVCNKHGKLLISIDTWKEIDSSTLKLRLRSSTSKSDDRIELKKYSSNGMHHAFYFSHPVCLFIATLFCEQSKNEFQFISSFVCDLWNPPHNLITK